MIALRRVADSSLLWVVGAGVLALGGGRFGRRAALRGLVSAGLASAVAQGPLRPLARNGPASRPVTSALGFAVGAAQELPLTAAPLAGLASAVAYSRVQRGVDDPGDVVAAAVIGTGIALATRRLWPVAPHTPAETRRVFEPTMIDPSPEGDGVIVVVNSSAGPGGSCADEVRSELPHAEVIEIGGGDELEAALRDAVRRALVVGVSGGDGSVNAAATLAAENNKPLFVVPGGTLNHFAFALGVMSVADAAEAVRVGRTVAVDRAVIDGHSFVNTASIGSYVDLVDARERLEDRIGKWPAMMVALVGVLRQADPVELELDGDLKRVWMIFIGNCRYHPAGFGPSWRERLDDGLLDIRIVHASQPWSRTRLVASVLAGRLARCAVYEQRFVPSVRVRSLQGALRLARDGETFDGSAEFTIDKAEEPLVVYVPKP